MYFWLVDESKDENIFKKTNIHSCSGKNDFNFSLFLMQSKHTAPGHLKCSALVSYTGYFYGVWQVR